jgi:Fe-S-cluster containining protein
MLHSQIEEHIVNFKEELCYLQEYPYQEMVDIIQDVGFSCTCCGKCCTAAFNGHIYLLSEDIQHARRFNPDLLVPAPGFELADREGRMYASSYAIKMTKNGFCPYLSKGYCSDYLNRFFICRIYPYMLHRELDESGKYSFRQISGLNLHGEYHVSISHDEAQKIADMVYAYEQAYIEHMIRFYQYMQTYFTDNNLRYSHHTYDRTMRSFQKGNTIEVLVFEVNTLTPHFVSLASYNHHFHP